MNKVVYGLILGGVLGIFDGLTAWFTPDSAIAASRYCCRLDDQGDYRGDSDRLFREESAFTCARHSVWTRSGAAPGVLRGSHAGRILLPRSCCRAGWSG